MTECPKCGRTNWDDATACQHCGLNFAAGFEKDGGRARQRQPSVTSQILKLGLAVVSPATFLVTEAIDLARRTSRETPDEWEPISPEGALLLTAETAFSRLSREAKNRWFEWLIPVARLDRVVNETVLGTIYLRFSAAHLTAQDREAFLWSLFGTHLPPEPVGEPDLGGEFYRELLLWDALKISGVDPSEKAHRYISKLDQLFELGKPLRHRVKERARRVQWGEKIESAGDKLSENPVFGLFGAGAKTAGGWLSDFLRSPADTVEKTTLVDRSDLQNRIEAALSESALFRAEVERLGQNPKGGARRLTEINTRLTSDLKEDAVSLCQKMASMTEPGERDGCKEAVDVIEKVLELEVSSDRDSQPKRGS
jgi:hypothetical protein